MPDTPDHRDLWHELNQARLDIAELRGMLSMHFSEGQHHSSRADWEVTSSRR